MWEKDQQLFLKEEEKPIISLQSDKQKWEKFNNPVKFLVISQQKSNLFIKRCMCGITHRANHGVRTRKQVESFQLLRKQINKARRIVILWFWCIFMLACDSMPAFIGRVTIFSDAYALMASDIICQRSRYSGITCETLVIGSAPFDGPPSELLHWKHLTWNNTT